jgi:8-oxo-dGTP pyrophosphatase MutT (NUDIX family)
VAGGIASGDNPLECLIKEAMEEASIEERSVKDHVMAAGAITYIFRCDSFPFEHFIL